LEGTSTSSSESDEYNASNSSISERVPTVTEPDPLMPGDQLDESINSDDSDSLITKKRFFKYNVNRIKKSSFKQKSTGMTSKGESGLSGVSYLPSPVNLSSFGCPLNTLLYHINHHHHQQTNFNNNQNQLPM